MLLSPLPSELGWALEGSVMLGRFYLRVFGLGDDGDDGVFWAGNSGG